MYRIFGTQDTHKGRRYYFSYFLMSFSSLVAMVFFPCSLFLLWRLQLERVGVAIKEIEQANHGSDLHNLAIVKVCLQFIPQRLVHVARARRHDLSETQRRQFAPREQVAMRINMVE